MQKKPYANFNILEFFENRPLSWSSLNSFSDPQWGDPEKWFRRYILGEKDEPSAELIFGSKVDKRIQADPLWLPELERFPAMQYKMTAVYKKINLLGFADGWDVSGPIRLKDDKTGRNPWTQKKADTTGQLTFYAALIYLMHKINPEDIAFHIDWLPTVKKENGTIAFAKPFKIHTFHTKRSMVEVLEFLTKIESTVEEMEYYVRNHG